MYKSRRNHLACESGFTLVELLVVIAIIAILTAIAVPVFLHQRQKAYDASLRSDIRAVAQAYTEWSTEPGHTNEFFATHIGRVAAYAVGEGQDRQPTPPDERYFKNLPGGIDVPVTPKSFYEIVVVAKSKVGATTYNTPHEEGEFCIVGRLEGSSWYHQTGMGAGNYDKLLFWDSKLGGITTMDELVKLQQAGQDMSCYEHPKQFAAVSG